ncbi:MAG: glycoside hydrolase family 15 protein [Variovorax sp.]
MNDQSPRETEASTSSSTAASPPASASSAAYKPIADYALIGDCHGCALVAKDGRIDWAALRRFDADPLFCRILDDQRGGFWSLHPRGEFTSRRAYLPGTNILRTVFECASGSVAVTDFMPVGRKLAARTHDYVHLNAPGWIVRRVECLTGEVDMQTAYRPSMAFAAESAELLLCEGAVRAGREMPTLYADLPFTLADACARSEWRMRSGERRDLVVADNTVEGQSPLSRIDAFFDATRAFWEEWIGYCRYRGKFEDEVQRSALVLKLLTFTPSGAMVAAPTTSLPEEIGGKRNWDYRYCWVRDSSFALYALSVLGYSGEAQRFHDFLLDACARSLPEVRPMYGIDGELKLPEKEHEHLEGYCRSAPVRSGNGAYLQRQIDVYGQTLDLALMYQRLGGRLDEQYKRLLGAIAAFIANHWHEPDQGIWEMRGDPRQFVHGKLMSWAGLDRAAQLLDKDASWRALAERVKAEILAHAKEGKESREGAEGKEGKESGKGRLQQAYDGGTDASVLLAPMLGFPLEAEMLKRTIDDVRETLGQGEFVARYRCDDGVGGGEGAFVVCSSWLADAELANGRVDAARELIEKLLARANDVGLYAEEIDPESGAFLGNFPQALTHLGLIGNIVNLQLAEKQGIEALAGSYADRAQRVVGATFGWRGLVAGMKQMRRVGRLFSSRRSQLPWP